MLSSYHGKVVIEYSADKDKLISLINEITEHATQVSILSRRLVETLHEDGEQKE